MYAQRVLAALLATTGAAGATVALTSNAPIVSSDGQARTVKVQYGDLNLSTPKGKEVLSQRIHQAVDLVCFQPDPRALQQWSQYRKCMQTVTDSAWSQIRWPDTRVTVRNESVQPPPPAVE
jgi:UrcA family protein